MSNIHKNNNNTGWWFATWIIMNFIFPYIGNNDPNWLICFREVETHQPDNTNVIVTTIISFYNNITIQNNYSFEGYYSNIIVLEQ